MSLTGMTLNDSTLPTRTGPGGSTSGTVPPSGVLVNFNNLLSRGKSPGLWCLSTSEV